MNNAQFATTEDHLALHHSEHNFIVVIWCFSSFCGDIGYYF